MAVTYNQVLKTATITTKQLTNKAIADTSTSRNGSLAIAQFESKQTIADNADSKTLIPFHAVDNIVVTQTVQEATKEDPFCVSESDTPDTMTVNYADLCGCGEGCALGKQVWNLLEAHKEEHEKQGGSYFSSSALTIMDNGEVWSNQGATYPNSNYWNFSPMDGSGRYMHIYSNGYVECGPQD